MRKSCGRGFSGLWGVCAAIAAAVLQLLIVAPAGAQGMMGMDVMPDLFTKRSVDGICKLLQFDGDQRDAAQTLFQTTKESHRKLTADLKAKMQKMQADAMESGDWSSFQKDLPTITEEFGAKQERLEKQFMDDLRSIASETQAAGWDRVERFRRRDQAMRFSFVSGAAVDLVLVVDRTASAPAGNSEFAETLLQYEIEIDKPIQLVMAMQKDQAKRQKELMEKAASDPMKMMEEVNKLMAEVYGVGKTMRTTNREYSRKLAALMTDEARVKFEDEVNRRSFARVYRKPYAAELMEAAVGLNDLTEDQRRELTSVREQYAKDLKDANANWARSIEEDEDRNNGALGRMMMSAQGGGDADAVKEARKARHDLDGRAEDRIKAILNESQRSRLPEKKTEAGQPWQDFMPDPDAMRDKDED